MKIWKVGLLLFLLLFLIKEGNFVFGKENLNLKLPFPANEKWTITWGYGDGDHVGKDKYALDFNLPGKQDLGKSILAAESGTVIFADWSHPNPRKSYGLRVDIDHGNGFITRYAHLKSISVKKGEKVYQGQEIGKCDDTGHSFGSHLHFALYKKEGNKYIGVKPEPMSGYTNFVTGKWYISDNWLKRNPHSFVEKVKEKAKKIVSVPEGLVGEEENLSFWDKLKFSAKSTIWNLKEL